MKTLGRASNSPTTDRQPSDARRPSQLSYRRLLDEPPPQRDPLFWLATVTSGVVATIVILTGVAVWILLSLA